MSMKNPMTPAGIEPATFRFVTQHLNHCATAVPFGYQQVPSNDDGECFVVPVPSTKELSYINDDYCFSSLVFVLFSASSSNIWNDWKTVKWEESVTKLL